MYEHLRTWTEHNFAPGYGARLDLWDTGRTDEGKHVLRYALAIIPDSTEERVTVFDGEDFRPAPSLAIDSDECAAALLDFFVHDGDVLARDITSAEVTADYPPRQRRALATHYEALQEWCLLLDEDRSEQPVNGNGQATS